MDIPELKEKLKHIIENKYQMDEETKKEEAVIRESIMRNIGSPDPELRDRLIYRVLSNWIWKYYSEEKVKSLFSYFLSPACLFYKISDHDPVFALTRTFSLLYLAVIVYRHRELPFLSSGDFENLLLSMEKYTGEESITEGYNKKYGWIHAPAHCADLLEEMILSQSYSNDRIKKIFGLIKIWLLKSDHAYSDGEEERLASAFSKYFSLKVYDESLVEEWMDSIDENYKPDYSNMDSVYRANNIKNFYKSLFFYIKNDMPGKKIKLRVESKLLQMLRIQ